LLLPPGRRALPQPPGAPAGVSRDSFRIGHWAASGPRMVRASSPPFPIENRRRLLTQSGTWSPKGAGYLFSRNQCLALVHTRSFRNQRPPL
jgi:hypothetical protein